MPPCLRMGVLEVFLAQSVLSSIHLQPAQLSKVFKKISSVASPQGILIKDTVNKKTSTQGIVTLGLSVMRRAL